MGGGGAEELHFLEHIRNVQSQDATSLDEVFVFCLCFVLFQYRVGVFSSSFSLLVSDSQAEGLGIDPIGRYVLLVVGAATYIRASVVVEQQWASPRYIIYCLTRMRLLYQRNLRTNSSKCHARSVWF